MVFFSLNGLPLQNPYTLLSLPHPPASVSDDEINKTFKKLMLQLHPDKQPLNQSPEEAEVISIKLHDVMDAKSFLLDGEYLAARREYDSLLIKNGGSAPQVTAQTQSSTSATVPSSTTVPKPEKQSQQQQTASNTTTTNNATTTAESTKKSNTATSTPNNNNNTKAAATPGKKNTKPSSAETKKHGGKSHGGISSVPKNGAVKQWGKVNRPVRRASLDKKTAPVHTSKRSTTATNTAAKGNNGNANNAKCTKTEKKIGKASTKTSKTGAFNDSCGDCSTTDDCSSTSDDNNNGGSKHTYLNATKMHNKIPSSNRPSVRTGSNTASRNSSRVSKPTMSKSNCGSIFSGSAKTCKQTKKQVGAASSPATPSSAPGANPNFSTFIPAINTLTAQYNCPITNQLMKNPYIDYEGNSYEKVAIFKYLESSNVSPITGNPLSKEHLKENKGMLEKIRYTQKLKSCLDTLQQQQQQQQNSNVITKEKQSAAPSASSRPQHQQSYPSRGGGSNNEIKYKSLREAVDSFITDLNNSHNGMTSTSLQQQKQPIITLNQLDNWGITSFTYLNLKFRLEVPTSSVADNILLQTWYDQTDKKKKLPPSISGKVVQFNASLQKLGLQNNKLTFRSMNNKYAFTMNTQVKDPTKFSKMELRHGMEYFIEMSIKLHNIMFCYDVKTITQEGGKVRLFGTK